MTRAPKTIIPPTRTAQPFLCSQLSQALPHPTKDKSRPPYPGYSQSLTPAQSSSAYETNPSQANRKGPK
ncbi:hypothetical protein BO94DRAFT_536502 [Aspergillus sclerotioniger CBS 115572]|uniref:Uncharacterized protein n=1 Tax=Aspergillus sclerotioniger CBS 115572 TaxID=1450535 RepID=A0A317WI26_9EURO|nr:hypothetical protein BO94DRAFT_536502 [Aspergillus sclerotioniger CBS 115572]PWY83860.1 hypothetical protein BO94DRAFT_536502 [Aspergillus sclerotioniger CBS 115572]